MGASPFVDDPGPGFNPEEAAAGAEQVRNQEEAEQRQAGLDAFTIEPVAEAKVRAVLFNVGDGVHAVAGVGEYDWVMTQRDLDRIAPPLTRILNRYDTTRAIAAYSDELAVALGVGLYGWRSALERVAVLRAQEAEGPPPPEPPPAPRAPAPAPPPEPPPGPGLGADHFPGAGAPQDLGVAEVEVVPGYVTRAEQLRAARQRGEHPNAVPREAPGAP